MLRHRIPFPVRHSLGPPADDTGLPVAPGVTVSGRCSTALLRLMSLISDGDLQVSAWDPSTCSPQICPCIFYDYHRVNEL